MGNDLLPENRGDQGIRPRHTARPGNRFQPLMYPEKNVQRYQTQDQSYHGCQRQNEPNSGSLPELYDINQGYESDPVEAYDVTWSQNGAATTKASDHEKWDSASAKFIRSCSRLCSGWGGRDL